MSAEVLRKAAALMRERAEAATPGRWKMDSNGCCVVSEEVPSFVLGERTGVRVQDQQHAASWHPAVALAVADWLDQTARLYDGGSLGPLDMPAALAVASAYLGTDA